MYKKHQKARVVGRLRGDRRARDALCGEEGVNR